ncbi:diphthine methyltransferase [Diorhabda sublineata]|uniref:diphthine methyltransferase n=1 Tax=Diorhabda sublineata TaxID=1163346 RepID=UPI0024E1725E|nr:diphthine methyltransferase [Diorhabda sublineata]
MESLNIETIYSFDTEYSADSVEWCPHKPNQNIFVCANYQLIESTTDTCTTKRLGRLLLFSIHHRNGLKLLQRIDTPAILDQKWCHKKIDNDSILGVVDAEKSVSLYKLNGYTLELELITTYKVDSDTSETLVLSLDWSKSVSNCNEIEIACSDSKGNIHLLELDNNILVLKDSWHGHDFEAWITGFYYWDTNIIFSGGDDCLFLKFDKRVGSQPISKNKNHGAGVTSFHSNSFKEYLVASGSYDEHVRLWDVRKMKSEIDTIKMPGTLWRLKWDPFEQNKLLAACMLGGVHILNIDTNNRMDLIASYFEHKNISYGADWSYLDKDECNKFDNVGDCIIGSCSFYDHLLCISKVNFKIK